ncbi:MAG TPA: malto-oligosyltrehalose synthase [Xanthomonadales bacterium]|nr:malto-oligosyltrehalose synthase [Xanthomonadales bacterium]
MSAPRATLRLQFHAGFTLRDAVPHVPYFAALGISHVYASPLAQAREGSTHGYDCVDCERISGELGGEAALRELVAALRAHDMGLVLDIVPNHMAASAQNAWWRDVLARGRDSPHAAKFDIDWHVPDAALANKVLLPVLGQPYGAALAAGELRVELDGDVPVLRHPGGTLPLTGASRAEAGAPAERVHALLESQSYRLAWWRAANDEINWRRFFDVSELVGLRAELPAVFDACHALVARLWAEGLVDGVRVDHVDGLADPRGYCRRLRATLEARAAERPEGLPRDPWIVVEKILAHGETLPPDWPVAGTTGYEFMAQVASLLQDAEGVAAIERQWRAAVHDEASFADVVRAAREEAMDANFPSELERTARAFHACARSALETRDYTLRALRAALRELLRHFPVYRDYARERGPAAQDPTPLATAEAAARSSLHERDHHALDFVLDVLRRDRGDALELAAARLFRQITPPLAAKSVEDTAFYRHGALLARNEVGADPGTPPGDAAEFHAACAARARTWPHTLLATATHDHKRGEDVRARLAVLSEVPGRWGRWQAEQAVAARRLVAGVADADLWMLLQTLVGTWAFPSDAGARRACADRIVDWQRKALREAKRRSSWLAPDEAYEGQCARLVRALVAEEAGASFREALDELVTAIAGAALRNSLAQVVLRTTTPGVPDLYQGTEYPDLSLVDPDNRRPVDFLARASTLAPFVRDGWRERWRDPALKQSLLASLLALRARRPALFADGRYEPLAFAGAQRARAFGYVRRRGSEAVLVVVALRTASVLPERPWLDGAFWADTRCIADELPEGGWRDALGGPGVAREWRLCDLVGDLPVAVLERDG